MISLPQSDGTLILIRQTVHAGHSAQLAKAWRRPSVLPAEPWHHLILAVQRHDDGWSLTEHYPTLDPCGRPYDFKELPSQQHIQIWRRGVDLAEHRHHYQALLTAQHARSVYVQYPRTTDQRAQQAFIEELTLRMDKYLDRLAHGSDWETTAVEPHNLAIAQQLVSFFDAFSLAMLGGLPWSERSPTTRFGNHEATLLLTRSDTDTHAACVGPWPFAMSSVALPATLMHLKQHTFSNAAQFAQQLQLADPIEQTWILEPAT